MRSVLPALFFAATPWLSGLQLREARAASPDCERLAQAAEQLLRSESNQPALRAQRVAAFRSAAQRLAQEIDAATPGSTAHLVMMFRLGLYLYLANEAADAQILLAECQQHPQLTDPAATWNGESIREQLRKFGGVRIYASSDSDGSAATSHSPVEGGARLSAHSSKGGITLEPMPPNEPYTTTELATLHARVALTRFPEQAATVGAKLLSAIPNVLTTQREGLTLLAIGDAEKAAKLADALVAARQELWKTIADRKDTPPRLLTYANLHDDDGEALGQQLSSAIHFRTSARREGYYCPIDRSLVLRKGIVGMNGMLYLGTALHEVAHAVIHADFPGAPAFLDEGVAALHEERHPDGRPRDNYRLYWLLVRLEQGTPLSLSQELREGTANNPLLRDAIARYTAMLLYEAEPGGAALGRYYRRLRDGKKLDAVTELQRALQLPDAAALDARFIEFVRARDVSLVDERWSELKPRLLRMKESGSGPSSPSSPSGPGGPGIGIMQIRQVRTGGRPPPTPQPSNPGQVAR